MKLKTKNGYYTINPIDELVNIMKKRFLNDHRLRHFDAKQQITIEKEIKRETKEMGKRMSKKLFKLYLEERYLER